MVRHACGDRKKFIQLSRIGARFGEAAFASGAPEGDHLARFMAWPGRQEARSESRGGRKKISHDQGLDNRVRKFTLKKSERCLLFELLYYFGLKGS